jgi:adhesin/invasin
MSTIVTRKSLALGAIVALATTAFAGTPASAAGEIVVVPSAGTSYSTLITDTFVLETSFAPGVVNGNAQLKYQIKTATAVSVKAKAGTAALTSTDVNTDTAAAGVTGDASDATAFVQYVTTGTGTLATNRNFLGLNLSAITYTSDSVDAVVTAFVDSNNDDKLSAGEWSTAKTVSFKKYSDVTATIALDEPKVGDVKAKGYVTLAGLNQSQIQSAVKLSFKKSASVTLDTSDVSDTANAVAAANGLVAAADAAGAYTATTGSVDSADGFDTNDTVYVSATVAGIAVGTPVSKTATARSISKFEATVDVTDNGLANGNVRLNSEYSTSAVVYSNATTVAPLAGVAVTATVVSSRTTFATTAGSEQSVTVNGVKYSTYAALAAASIALTSDANGKVNVKVTPANFATADTIDIKFAAQNLDKTVRATQTAAVYTVSDDASAATRKVAKNESATINYTVKDQFSKLSAATNQRLVISATNAATATQYIAIAAGKATVVVAPTKDSTDSVVVTSAIQASATATDQSVSWTAVSGATDAGAITINVSAVADDFDTAPVLATVNGAAWTSTSTAKQILATHDATDLTPNSATITGSVSTQGQLLTVSGSGLRFVYNGKAYTDTFTVPVAASTNGDFTVKVASVKSGAQVVTLKTGAVTKTITITFADGVLSQLKNTVVSAPSAAQAGRAVTVSATLTDANGNVIAGKLVKFAVAGVGSLSSSDAVTDASGVATVRLVSSYGEDGDSVVTVSHNGSDDATDSSTATDKDDFTLAKTITFGITDAQIDNVGKRVTAVASFSKGKTVAFYVNGVKKWSKLSASDADVVLNYNLKKGRNTVTMKISGGFITSEVIIVK